MAIMTPIKTDIDESQFLSLLSIVANKYGMMLDIDIETNIVTFTGDYDKEKEIACALELEDMFGSYAA